MKASIIILLIMLLNPSLSYARSALDKFNALQQTGILLVDSHGKILKSTRAERPFVPASTTKLLTAWLALQHWGEQYRFRTQFFYDASTQTLWVKGSGDPYLVSEELSIIAQRIAQKGIRHIKRIALDTTLFENGLVLSGTGHTNNPYDAVPSALAANFNTVYIKKKHGKVISAEPQTPLTPFAKSMKKHFHKGTLRVNTGRNPHNAERYFAELLSAFLRKNNVTVGNKTITARVPKHLPVLYIHQNSRTLGAMIKPMLQYSTNFIANQLALSLAADHYQQAANAQLVKQYMNTSLQKSFGWKNFNIEDGAGLSRKNRLSSQQLVTLLQHFLPWKHLLPKKAAGVYAKSGTLRGVSTLAGYVVKNKQWRPFALMINQAVPIGLRKQVAIQLRQNY